MTGSIEGPLSLTLKSFLHNLLLESRFWVKMLYNNNYYIKHLTSYHSFQENNMFKSLTKESYDIFQLQMSFSLARFSRRVQPVLVAFILSLPTDWC